MLDLSNIRVGLMGTADLTVTPEHTAPRVGSGRIAVLATPVMMNLIEAAALTVVEDLLPAGYQSLGIRLDVRHFAATPATSTTSVTTTSHQRTPDRTIRRYTGRCSLSSSRRLRSSPHPKPPRPPSEATTRWQGTTIAVGLLPHALPTAHEPLQAGRHLPLVQTPDAQSLAMLQLAPIEHAPLQGLQACGDL